MPVLLNKPAEATHQTPHHRALLHLFVGKSVITAVVETSHRRHGSGLAGAAREGQAQEERTKDSATALLLLQCYGEDSWPLTCPVPNLPQVQSDVEEFLEAVLAGIRHAQGLQLNFKTNQPESKPEHFDLQHYWEECRRCNKPRPTIARAAVGGKGCRADDALCQLAAQMDCAAQGGGSLLSGPMVRRTMASLDRL